MHNYHDVNKMFPKMSAGGTVTSNGQEWRSYSTHDMLLPYLEQKDMADAVQRTIDQNRLACCDGNSMESVYNGNPFNINLITIGDFRCPWDTEIIDPNLTAYTNYASDAGASKGWEIGPADQNGIQIVTFG